MVRGSYLVYQQKFSLPETFWYEVLIWALHETLWEAYHNLIAYADAVDASLCAKIQEEADEQFFYKFNAAYEAAYPVFKHRRVGDATRTRLFAHLGAR